MLLALSSLLSTLLLAVSTLTSAVAAALVHVIETSDHQAVPHRPSIPEALLIPPAPPLRDTEIYSPELVRYLEHMPDKDLILLQELLQILHQAWKSQMDLLAWYNIALEPTGGENSRQSFRQAQAASTGTADGDEKSPSDHDRRSFRWMHPAERKRWTEDCRWLIDVSSSEYRTSFCYAIGLTDLFCQN
ncbi:hypothetical protein BD324DRAFT_386648 [Kockovaella imperatae]|uniref:Uncharacterized protein n=1 Tax=Kockovaella imperatae TaxID=4999 RepID=A0A1Y1UHQ6_9TREE|nr:hypothetical protein BD324DRAFT_386648 [Kockovaella imperatae]ORX37591.1 hypothetical protein BD324DRAFT_386648 [Kockovaella imperatae]